MKYTEWPKIVKYCWIELHC